jgi:hypothetical protein
MEARNDQYAAELIGAADRSGELSDKRVFPAGAHGQSFGFSDARRSSSAGRVGLGQMLGPVVASGLCRLRRHFHPGFFGADLVGTFSVRYQNRNSGRKRAGKNTAADTRSFSRAGGAERQDSAPRSGLSIAVFAVRPDPPHGLPFAGEDLVVAENGRLRFPVILRHPFPARLRRTILRAIPPASRAGRS